jgi:Mlc titration factor MtfA (ptsG expression regulator)
MLTFGFRDFMIKSIKNIIIYPTQYYSEINKVYHKGEFNPRLKTLVLSWDSFLEGHRIEDDKLNLGIHEFAHAIHFNSMNQEDINSILFVDTFNELRNKLSSNEALKKELVTSELLRSYALTNDSELLAVIIETFIETPQAFKKLFPEVYNKVKQMLNFNFSGY